jgi:hypothetical protein
MVAQRDFLLLWQRLFLISRELFLPYQCNVLIFILSKSHPLTMVNMVSAHHFTQYLSLNTPLQCEIEAWKLFSFNSDYS